MALSALLIVSKEACYDRDESGVEFDKGLSEAGVSDGLSHS